jgi:pyruvate formate-lyase/glycerol dehydratase family glycyl radical enzyme
MNANMIAKGFGKPTPRVQKLRDAVLDATPYIESERAVYLTESYMQTENEPIVLRRAKAFDNICKKLTVTIRDNELLVGTLCRNPRSCQLYPEYSYEWLIKEFDTIDKRLTDRFTITDADKEIFKKVLPYWKGKTVNDLATSYMSDRVYKEQTEYGIFTTGNYWFGGVGHIIIDYAKAIGKGYKQIMHEAAASLQQLDDKAPDYVHKSTFLQAVIIMLNAGITFAHRYADKAEEIATSCTDPTRKAELLVIAQNCRKVPENPATNFYEACQSFIFTQMLMQLESSGHSVSPGRFDQYMYPYLKNDTSITHDFAQELLDCLFVKLNDLNKVRDDISAQGFAGYQVFQNINAGGQTPDGLDATNELSYMMVETSGRLMLSAPSFSIRYWENTPDEFLFRCAELVRTGVGFPAMYNDEVIIPELVNRGIEIHDARNYGLIGCVEPSIPGKEQGWHDAAFFNAAKVLEITINNGKVGDIQVGPQTGDVTSFTTFEQFEDAFKKQIQFFVRDLVEADNSVDYAHMERCPLPFLSSFVADCISTATDICAGGAKYNFTGPQEFGLADVGDSVAAIKKHVYDNKEVTWAQLKEALDHNFGYPVDDDSVTDKVMSNAMEQSVYEAVCKVLGKTIGRATKASMSPAEGAVGNPYAKTKAIMERTTWFGNDDDDVDLLTKRLAQVYCYEVQKYKNPRGGQFHAGIYPVSANVLFGKDVGAMADGRLARKPLADGCSPRAGADTLGPTAAALSVAKLDHQVASNGTLYNMKFTPTALEGDHGLQIFCGFVRTYFAHKGQHIQFNVVSRDTLIDAQKHPENHRDLVVRVAGYSAMFVELAKEVQDDIISRTEQTF